METVHFAEKRESPLLQFADACAFAFRRSLASQSRGDELAKIAVPDDLDEIGDAKVESDLQTFRGSASIFYDLIPENDRFRPYVGAGFGVAHQDVSGDLEDDGTGLTLHGEAGLSFASTRHLELVTAYRFEWFETDLEDFDDRLTSHQIRIGARFYY